MWTTMTCCLDAENQNANLVFTGSLLTAVYLSISIWHSWQNNGRYLNWHVVWETERDYIMSQKVCHGDYPCWAALINSQDCC